MQKPLMAKATAVWLVDNTTLSFKQIADFCGLHELEVQGIADGDVAAGVKGFDPVASNQLDPAEIEKGEADPAYVLKLKYNAAAEGEEKRRGPRYTPLSKRQDRPAAILWLVKFHPELTDAQIAKLVGTTKPTIASIRDRSHWNIQNIQPIDPVALGLSKQVELDAEVQKAARKRSADVMSDDERRKLVSTETSLAMGDEPRLPSSIAGLENFSLGNARTEPRAPQDFHDAESFFRKPAGEAPAGGSVDMDDLTEEDDIADDEAVTDTEAGIDRDLDRAAHDDDESADADAEFVEDGDYDDDDADDEDDKGSRRR